MGEMADYYNDYQAQTLEDLLNYQSGTMGVEEAIDCGVLDEFGSLDVNAPILVGVEDINSLIVRLNECDLAITKYINNKLREQIDRRDLKQKGTKICYCCGTENLHWKNVEGKWRLFDATDIHKCPVNPINE